MARRLRIAVVGTGFGARIQVPGFQASGRFEVSALVGRDLERTRAVAARLGVARAYASLGDALAGTDLDAVSVAAPPATHAALASAATRAGKHVLCEKPMARTAEEAAAMCAAATSAGVVAMIDFEFRFHPARAMLGRLLEDGSLGEPQLLACIDAIPLYVAPYKSPPAWWHDGEAGGGWLGASGSHLIDASRVWLGDAGSVIGMVDTVGPGSADDTFALLLRMRSGARAVLHQSAAVLGPRFQSLRVSGSDGTAWLDDAWRLWRVGRTGEPALVDVASDLAEPVVDVPSHAGPFASRELPSFVRLAQGFADAIEGRTRRPRSPAPPTFADGLACQRIMDAARASSRSGLRVDLFS